MNFPLFSMAKNTRPLLCTVAVITSVLALTACQKLTRLSTNAGGHQITAQVEGQHSLDTGTNGAVIVGEFGKITVEAARVQLGDGPWNRIPEGVPVSLGISKHKSWVKAGGVSIKTSQ
ncbi:MAG TPA: hypothetical protein VHI52_00300 [Verrucomicrobiae bacterium]|nr:hypothetical protein [Verrucomicrobiae bacterium]